MFSLIISIIALGLIIMIHEFGHFIAARACGVGVIEFSLGMGPVLYSKVVGMTRYSWRALPFGGSCMMLGEEMEESEEEKEQIPGKLFVDGRYYDKQSQFVNKAAWKRFLIIAAGPIFNFVLAFLLSIIIVSGYGFDKPIVTETTENMPVAMAGIEAGDEIYELKVGNTRMTVECARDINMFMMVHENEVQTGQEFIIRFIDVSDGNQKKTVSVTPVYDAQYERYRLGFSYSLANTKAESLFDVLKFSVYNVKNCIRSVIESLRMIVKGKVGRQDVMGPVRMVAVMDESVDEAASYGIATAIVALLDMMILISGSLGAMNLLPLPALDGGRIIFILFEMITRHPVPKELEARIHMGGMLILLVLMVLILTNDVTMLIWK